MRRLVTMTMIHGTKVLMSMVFLAAMAFPAARAFAGCGCMDVALVIDDTGSMGGAISNVQAQLKQIINIAEFVSGGDLHMGLATFPSDNVVINVPLTTDLAAVEAAVQGLVAAGGAGVAESSDEVLQYVITGAADPTCIVSNALTGSVVSNGVPSVFGTLRTNCVKIAVLVTDAPPGECADAFTLGVSDVHAHSVALAAANAGVRIAAIYVPDSGEDPEIKAIMEDYATTSGGTFNETAANADGTGDGISAIVAECGTIGSPPNATRNSRFWFTHAFESGSNCVSLLDAILINGSLVDLGFLTLPTASHTADVVPGANDALIEALSFYWRGVGVTGESGGTQSQKLPGSSLCRYRKQLAVELIAATANVHLLNTQPANVTYSTGTTTTNFSSDLLAQARAALTGVDPSVMVSMTALLRLFNSSGLTNNYPSGLVECSPQSGSLLRALSRDPTTQTSCPGVNSSCQTATTVFFSTNAANPFASAVFRQSVSTVGFGRDIPSPTCNNGGPNAVWQIPPSLGVSNRQFTASTSGNFNTMVSVWSGTCSNLTAVTCADANSANGGERVTFTTDGVNTFFVVGEGASGNYGKLQLKITSP
jgi:hypothetical protein